MNQSDVLIASGESQSGALDLWDQVIVGIQTPADWTAANITFVASMTGRPDSFVPVHDAEGTELEITAAGGRHIVIPPDATRSFRYVKLRSGTSALAVNQGGDRLLNVAIAASAGA